MTKDEALKLALEALEELNDTEQTYAAIDRGDAAITAIKEALALPAIPEGYKQETDWEGIAADQAMTIALMKSEQEPVGVIQHLDELNEKWTKHLPIGTKLYTSPPKREWVGLTDLERLSCQSFCPAQTVINTEAKLKEKNT